MKKVVSVLLALCMALGVSAVMAEASQDGLVERLLYGEMDMVELAGGVFLVPHSENDDVVSQTENAYVSRIDGVQIALFSVAWLEDDWAKLEQLVDESDMLGIPMNTHQVAMLNAMYNSQIFDQQTTIYIVASSNPVDIGMPNTEMVYTNEVVLPEGAVIYAQTFENSTNGVLVIGNDMITHEEAMVLAQQIMKYVSTNPVEIIE